MVNLQQNHSDAWKWSLDSKGEFSVKSVTKWVDERKIGEGFLLPLLCVNMSAGFLVDGGNRHDNANYKMPIEYDMGLRALGNDLDVRGLGRYIKNNKLIMVYCEHFETKLDTYASPPPTSTVVIEEMPSSTPVAKPTKTKRLLLEYTPTVNVEDQVVANENANETVDGIMQELLSMNYEFDPFGCEQEETRVVTNEPEETLVEGETVLDGEEDSGTEEDESDDEDYLFDEDTYLEEVNVDMADYHFNIDADVEWIRHSESVQEPEYDVNPDDLDVIDNDNFESGTDSDDDGIEKVRRKKLKQIKKAKESEDNIVHKHFFFVGQTFASADDVKERVRLHSIETRRQLYLAKNDKVRIRAKCFGRNPVFILDGEGPSTTDVGPKKKTIKGKGKQDDTPLGPNKKGISSGGRGRPKPLAPDECPWAVQITKVKNSETWEVRTYNEEHKCLQSRKIIACTHKFLSKGIVDQVEKNPDIPIRALQEELQRKYELGVSRQKAFRAKAAALNQVKGDYRQQYTMLRDYCLELRRANHDTTIKIEVERDSVSSDENTRMFKRIYICLGPLKKGFKACGRDLLGLDGAFMKGPYPGQLLTAIGLDANNGIYPLAYAIVEKETTDSWTWFLECVGDDLGMTKDSNFTFISDRQKGLAIAMANVFPCAEHRSCLRHIHENMKKQWNGQAYKELLWRCASVTTVPYFDKAMQDLKDFNKECFEWLAKIPPHSWSRSHFSGRAKSDILLNNLCECFNGKILDARDAPIITALEYIREYLMRRMVNVIAVIKKTDGPLTPSATKLLKIAMDRANNCTVAFNGGEEYEVKGQSGSQCVVNVVKKVCSCRKWELTGIPCSHAIAANYNMSLNGVQVGIPEEWVDKCYWLATWQKTYSYTIGCLNGRVMWKKSQIPTTLTPPKHNTPVGRPRKNRRKSKEEKAEMVKDGKLSRAYKTVTCMKCGNLGHNSRSCKGQKDPYTGTSQTTPSTAPAKKPSDAGTRKRPSDAPAPSTAPAKMNQATKKQCAMSN
ncbi:hypothetical protein Tco_1316640 [Tanacetum coccineum]